MCNFNVLVGRPIPGDVYERIQNLESRILQLESLSPEYFDMMVCFKVVSLIISLNLKVFCVKVYLYVCHRYFLLAKRVSTLCVELPYSLHTDAVLHCCSQSTHMTDRSDSEL